MADEYDAVSNEYIHPSNDADWGMLGVCKDNNQDSSSSDTCNRINNGEKPFLRGFWGCVKAEGGGTEALSSGIIRSYITGVTSLSLADHTSGYNIQKNISFDHSVAGLCGLKKDDVSAALNVILKHRSLASHSFTEDTQSQKYMKEMVDYFNGYHFCNYQRVDSVFNTTTCLGYLQVNMPLLFHYYNITATNHTFKLLEFDAFWITSQWVHKPT